MLVLLGLGHEPSTLEEGVTGMRALCVLLAVTVTGAVLSGLRAIHPPAGASVLLVALGFITSLGSLVIVFAGVVITTVLGLALNRALGQQYDAPPAAQALG